MKIIVRFLIVFMLVACGNNVQPTAKPAAQPTNQQQTVDGISITLTEQIAPAINKQQAWIIALQRDGKPIDNADVYLDLDMPSMPMGQNKPLAVAQGNGSYKAEGTYTMGGLWHVTVHATIDGKDIAAKFDVNVPE